jgi:hypothetical protein
MVFHHTTKEVISEMADTYAPYYLRAIEAHNSGFKPVYGPTGLGKTYGIEATILERLQQGEEKKFIYASHRHVLIQEMEHKLENRGIKTAYLRPLKDNLEFLHAHGELAEVLHGLIQNGFFEGGKKGKIPPQNHLRHHLQTLEHLSGDAQNSSLTARILKPIFAMHFKAISQILNKTLWYQLVKLKNSNWLQDDRIWRLFPYIQFEQDSETKVLLSTVQKLCAGFEAGQRTLRFLDLRDHIIFLDEFDYLEPEFLSWLCHEKGLTNPLDFLALFLEQLPKLMEKEHWHEQSSDLYPV